MKKRMFLAFLSLFMIVAGRAQEEKKFTGIWEGILHAGVDLRIVFHIHSAGTNGLAATADSPDQSAYGLKCDTVIASGEQLRIEMRSLRAVFFGRLAGDTVISGQFNQGIDLPLVLKKVVRPSERKRPQTPAPPFSYRSEDVEYDNADRSLHYGATLTIPRGTGPFPAALLITGSGAQNRDEDILNHKTFAVLADALTQNGYMVLRVDDRGIGRSTGIFSQATTADFADDVQASLDYLLSRPEADKKKTGLIGHSEGGMIAPMVAARRKEVNFIVLLAGPGIPLAELLAQQNNAILLSTGISRTAADAYTALYRQLMTAVMAPDSLTLVSRVDHLTDQWIYHTDTILQKELGFNSVVETRKTVSTLVAQLTEKWFRYFLAFDPALYLQRLSCKVLVLNGSRDVQVLASSNLPAIEAALKKSRASYTIKELPGLNHLFQTCIKCTPAEYGELEETFSPVALQTLISWLDRNVK